MVHQQEGNGCNTGRVSGFLPLISCVQQWADVGLPLLGEHLYY
jgi:hypothetical protein